jgi:hypothetical protein
MVRALLTDHGFTLAVLLAVGVTAIFAFVLDAPPELVATLLVLGIFTAFMESLLRSNPSHRNDGKSRYEDDWQKGDS